MAHPRTLSAAVLPAALLLLTTCGHDVTAPPAPTQLVFIAQPRNIVAGHEFSQAVQVQAEDAHGNKVGGFIGSVTVALASNPGGSTLSGTTTVGAVDGIATFYNLSLDKTGTGYTLTASASGGGLAAPPSAAFDVAPGPATQLEFTVEPTTVTAGVALAPPLQVAALDPERSEEHTSELQSRLHLVCRLLLEKKKHHPSPGRSGRPQLLPSER